MEVMNYIKDMMLNNTNKIINNTIEVQNQSYLFQNEIVMLSYSNPVWNSNTLRLSNQVIILRYTGEKPQYSMDSWEDPVRCLWPL